MDALIKKRTSLKGRLEKAGEYADQLLADPTNVSTDELELRIEHLDELYLDFKEVQTEIEERAKDQNAQVNHRTEFENLYITCKAALKGTLKRLSGPTNPVTHNNEQANYYNKLPALPIPKFSGKFEDWIEFRDGFESAIHRREDMDPCTKLRYLKDAVQGEASSLLQAFKITNDNYVEAWELLKQRFENKRLIIFTHFKALFDTPKMQTDSAASLRKLTDVINENFKALVALGLKEDSADWWVLYLTIDKLSPETRQQWELHTQSTEMPTYKELKTFLDARWRALEAIVTVSSSAKGQNSSYQKMKKSTPSGKPSTSASVHVVAQTSAPSPENPSCPECGRAHMLYHCNKYTKASTRVRFNLIRKYNLCFNCLESGHSSRDCTGETCQKCDGLHHITIHYVPSQSNNRSSGSVSSPPAKQVTPPTASPVQSEGPVSTTTVVSHSPNYVASHHVLLSTAMIYVQDANNEYQALRALLDNGSQASFVSESAAQRLRLKRTRGGIPIQGIGNCKSGVRGSTRIKMTSKQGDYQRDINALILDKITVDLPSCKINNEQWAHLHHLPLADPEFNIPGPIDVLLGADVFAEIVLEGRIPSINGSPIAQNTQLGWVVSGAVGLTGNPLIASCHAVVDHELQDQLRQFWELDTVASSKPMSLEEKKCEAHYSDTVTREPSGRYVVQLPIKNAQLDYGNSLKIAIGRQYQIEKQFSRNSALKEQYSEFMTEYLELGHMVEVPEEQLHRPSYYLPHHAVVKEASVTTKLRVVFDGSAKTNSGYSLNDNLMSGPKLLADLQVVLLQFRQHRVAIVADVAKMYRQILMHPESQELQRIVWRENPEGPMRHFRLTTVTYGTAAAPYLAIRTLHQLAQDEKEEFPQASNVLLENCYVDDVVTGTADVESARQLVSDLVQVTERGGFHLRKWICNEAGVLESIPEAEVLSQNSWLVAPTDDFKTLGVKWDPNLDRIGFEIEVRESEIVTKRNVLSQIARIFDPLGLLSPVTITAKIFIQRLWLCGSQWDDLLPKPLEQEWIQFRDTLVVLDQLKVERCIVPKSKLDEVQFELHGFSDASESAYAAAVYLRCLSGGSQARISLVCAKARVSPLKQVSIPRLELCGALLLARLLNQVRESLTLEIVDSYCWTDSMIVLAWIQGHPNRWKTFVANRVSEIQDLVSPAQWHHVPTEANPADCASRGILPVDLATHDLWFNGPPFLSQDKSCWPALSVDTSQVKSVEERQLKPVVTLVVEDENEAEDLLDISRFSSLSKLVRVTAYVLRFVNNCRPHRNQVHKTPYLTSTEFNQALLFWIRKIQSVEFAQDISRLKSQTRLSKQSRLLSLAPFLDPVGILRVGGRLRNSNLSYNMKHPILLPRDSHLTLLILRCYHLTHLHAGPKLLHSVIIQKFWIIRGKDVIRKFVQACVVCARYKASMMSQQMGNLPSCRVTPAKPFTSCGVDFCGPFQVKLNNLRGKARLILSKTYICVFVCMATKAIHLEVVSDLTSEAFIAALKRFFGRRGKSADIHSDCGTNFVGAQKELKWFLTAKSTLGPIINYTASEGVNWHFNPPGSPHMGGLWEAGVKSVKYHLKRVMTGTLLNFEELTTLTVQIESCLNSRPLCGMSNDPNDLSVLTPGHFLIGDSLTAVPEPDYQQISVSKLTRWQQIQKLYQQFWRKWTNDYVTTLQQRRKWIHPQPSLKIGDLVLLKDENLPPQKWHLARVIEIHPGQDGLVRVVTVQSQQGKFRRSVVKVCKLPIS